MGLQPLDAADFPEVAEVFLACHAIEPQFEYPFRELRCDIHADLYKRYKDRLSRRNLEAITPANPTAARAVLLALVEKATERLWQLEAEHQEVADIVDELQADILAFDDTKGGENLRRLTGSCNRLLLRNVEAVHKGRKDAGGGGGGGRAKKRSGRLLMTDENGTTRYVDDYEREKELKARLAEACGAVGWAGDEGTEQDRGRRTEDGAGGNQDSVPRTEDEDGTVRNGGPYEGNHPVGTTDLSGAIGNNGITGVVDHIVWTP